jgi:hypothetical protein
VTMVTDCPEIQQKPRIEELPVHRDKCVAALSKQFNFNICTHPTGPQIENRRCPASNLPTILVTAKR